jgi:hypothetical protein
MSNIYYLNIYYNIILMLVFNDYYDTFKKTHESELNIFVHLLTIFCGFFGVLSLLPFNYIFSILYLGHLRNILPKHVFYKTGLYVTFFTVLSNIYIISNLQIFYLLLFSFVTQEASHFITYEKTMASTYFNFNKATLYEYIIQSYLLLPLIIKHIYNKYFYSLFSSNNVSFITLPSSLNNHISLLEDYILSKNPPKNITTHIWYKDLDIKPKSAFLHIIKNNAIFEELHKIYNKNIYTIENIVNMDEIYVSAFTDTISSDKVFYSQHIDGPFGLLPGVIVNRTIISISSNDYINTNFPITNKKYTLTKNQCVSFDFNRTIHYIDKNKNISIPEYRIVLKGHYLIYPKKFKYYAKLYGYLNIIYDKIARKLFLYTINPDDASSNFICKIILGVTNNWYLIEKYIGMNNVTYLYLCMFISYYFNNFIIFLMYCFLMYIHSSYNLKYNLYFYLCCINFLYISFNYFKLI